MPVHFLAHVLKPVTIAETPTRSRVFLRGEVLTISDAIIKINTDTIGHCPLLDRIDGGVVMARGPWPDGLSKYEPGSMEWHEAREVARQAAHKLKLDDPVAGARALQRVYDDFGPLPTSRTVARYGEAR